MSSLKEETRTIDGTTFVARQFPAIRGFELLAKLLKSVGPAFSTLVGADPSADLATLAPVLAASMASLDPAAVTTLALEVLSCVTAMVTDDKGRLSSVLLDTRANIDRIFMGRLMVMFQALVLAVQVNFLDFMPGSIPTAP